MLKKRNAFLEIFIICLELYAMATHKCMGSRKVNFLARHIASPPPPLPQKYLLVSSIRCPFSYKEFIHHLPKRNNLKVSSSYYNEVRVQDPEFQ